MRYLLSGVAAAALLTATAAWAQAPMTPSSSPPAATSASPPAHPAPGTPPAPKAATSATPAKPTGTATGTREYRPHRRVVRRHYYHSYSRSPYGYAYGYRNNVANALNAQELQGLGTPEGRAAPPPGYGPPPGYPPPGYGPVPWGTPPFFAPWGAPPPPGYPPQ